MVGFEEYLPTDQQMTRMAGNAYSGFAAGPCLISLLFNLLRTPSSPDSDAEGDQDSENMRTPVKMIVASSDTD